jgi:hypothetical protein
MLQRGVGGGWHIITVIVLCLGREHGLHFCILFILLLLLV